MPIEVGIWRIGAELSRVTFEPMEAEKKLEDALNADIAIIDPGLMVVGRQVPTAFGKFIDLLAVDGYGTITVIELKRNRTPREVVAQVLDYASWVKTLTYHDITGIFAQQHGGAFEQAFTQRFNSDPPERLNESHRLIIVAGELDNSTERIIDYLSGSYGVPINAVFFRYFREGSNEYLARTWLIDPNQAEAQASRATAATHQEPWNGRDWYVSIGVGEHRTWEDCVKYGFVSAGQGVWYSRTLQQLPVGARIFACIPRKGYVGVGTVTQSAVPVREFLINVDGVEKPILELPLSAPNMADNFGNLELSEYVARVEWITHVPESQAIWENGMFANQNSACRLRSSFTLQRLSERFALDDS